MLKQIKRPVLQTLKRIGVHRGWNESNWRRERLAILCYHGVAIDDEDQWNPSLYVSAKWLETRLELLREAKFNVLPLGDAVRLLYEKKLPPRSVALTFDDGGYDFYARALPVLKKYEFPATVYLSTYYCINQRPIFPLSCYYLLWKARNSYKEGMLAKFGCPPSLDFHVKSDTEKAVDAIISFVGSSAAANHQDIVEQVAACLELDYNEFKRQRLFHLMNPSEVSAVAHEGIDVQLHTHRHRVPMDAPLFKREIEENRQVISELTGKDATHFCYPSGVYHQTFLPWLRELGVKSATTCVNGLASPHDDSLLLPRIADHSALDEIEFESSLVGIGTGLLRVRGGK